MRKAAATALATTLLGLPAPPAAVAQTAAGPVIAPTRDVAVTYRMTGKETGELRVAWLVAEEKVRIETPRGVIIQDGRESRDTVLMTEQRMFVTGTSDRRRGGGGWSLAEPGDTVTREGADRVAGHECAVWRIEAKKDDPDDEPKVKRACVTADGVPLRVVEGEGGEGRTATVATRVEYGRQDPAQFRVPEGYRPFDPSAFAPPQRR
ncbi:MAG: hypothetical protein ICV73_10175 [Acetobacteraceae bacterium]|nr:hypothetical protein [Acetobacteraceae bacterium]